MMTAFDDKGSMSSDDVDRGKKKVEEIVAKGVEGVDTILAHKEKDVMEV